MTMRDYFGVTVSEDEIPRWEDRWRYTVIKDLPSLRKDPTSSVMFEKGDVGLILRLKLRNGVSFWW